LKGEKHLLKGQIHVESSSVNGGEELPDSISVDVYNHEGTNVDISTARLIASGNDNSAAAVYEYSIWANSDGELSFVPQDSRYLFVLCLADNFDCIQQSAYVMEISGRIMCSLFLHHFDRLLNVRMHLFMYFCRPLVNVLK